ncbi:hypothetical protein H6F44_06055 [Pseudanabaena sp. FACHB-1277]|uniref:Uncharacterized protein n=1 Tax=Pseudanabaena cinerea FACHB-1277 TaxID=2949581 RepID=A0A926Z5K0_9CYAN|nr:hypothetical protein [Pseudanabaena cinerea]MBD2149688.1 hypothetical protein [Pseudanabaena cinerea FACHB-1277]
MIPTLDLKYAYSIGLGMIIALTGVSVWQKFYPPQREAITEDPTPKIIVSPFPSTLARPNLNDGENIGSLRVGNRTERSVRVVLFSRVTSQNVWQAIEPLNWDFAPFEGGKEGLILSLPNYKIAIGKGDVIFAFATDGSRSYWGPNIVGETDAPFWDSKNKEWSMVLQP